MQNEVFYKIIDKEIESLEKEHKKILDNKNFRDFLQRKSFIFYIWFLKNY